MLIFVLARSSTAGLWLLILSPLLSSSFEVGWFALSGLALFSTWSIWVVLTCAETFSEVLAWTLLCCVLSDATLLVSIVLSVCWAGLLSTGFCLSARCSLLFSKRSFAASVSLSITACLWVAWRDVVDLLSSNDKCTTSGDLSSLVASFTCNTTSLGSWLRRALDWFLLLLAFLGACWLFCLESAAVKVSPRSSLPRDPRWLFDLRLVRVCSSTTLSELSERLLSLTLVALTLVGLALSSFVLRLLSWRLLRLRSLWRLLSCWRLSWLLALSSVLALLSVVLLVALFSVSSACSFLWRGLDGLDLRGLRLLLSSASLLSSVLLSAERVSWRFCSLLLCWLVAGWGVAVFWLLLLFAKAVLSTWPNEPRLCAPVLTNASIASAASRLLTLDVVWACGACANKLDNQATACGCAAAIAVGCGATGADGVTMFWELWGFWTLGVSLVCGARADVTLLLLLLLRCSLLWLVLFCCCCVGVLCWALGRACAWSLLFLSAAWRGCRVGCCSGRSFSAVCQSTL